MQEYFFNLSDRIFALLHKEEYLSAYLSAEDSDFWRINHSKIRQAGTVKQAYLLVNLVRNKRTVKVKFSLSGDHDGDFSLWQHQLGRMRELVKTLPEDPYAVMKNEVSNSFDDHASDLPSSFDLMSELSYSFSTYDAVGIMASGKMMRGFTNSLGQKNWFNCSNFNCDWSIYDHSDNAVKNSYAGSHWSSSELADKLSYDQKMLSHLSAPSHSIKPGEYRVYLAPSAMVEIFELLSWNAFGLKSQKTKSSSLGRLLAGESFLTDQFNLREGYLEAASPRFNESGYLRAEKLDLITEGKYAQPLVSPQSAIEYGLDCNGASDSEAPHSLNMSGGKMEVSRVLQEIDHGLYISNLWYLNFSDLDACRMTGMTRFACFRVVNGQLQEPVNAMRFDESFYRMFGKNLVGLTDTPEVMMSSSTYQQRSSDSMCLPGALINDFRLTL